MAEKKTAFLILKTFPITAYLVMVSVVIFAFSDLRTLLVYDRNAILSGQLWRLATGHLVHFSGSHLALDLFCLGISGGIIESHPYPHFGVMCGFSAVIISSAMLAFLPDLQFYGGLSGIGFGAIFYLCLFRASESSQQRWLYVTIMIIALIKVCTEFTTGRALFSLAEGTDILSVPLAHCAGGLGAIFVFAVSWAKK